MEVLGHSGIMPGVRRVYRVALQLQVTGVGSAVIGVVAVTAAILWADRGRRDDVLVDAVLGTATTSVCMGVIVWLFARRLVRSAAPLPREAVVERRHATFRREVIYVLFLAVYVALFSDLIGPGLMGGLALGLGIGSLALLPVLRRVENSRRERLFRERGFRWTPRYYAG